MAAVMTWHPTCLVTTRKASARSSATASCRRTRSARRASRSLTAPNARSSCWRRAEMTVDERFTRRRERPEDEPLGTRNEIITGPVADWTSDFSHLEPEWAADPYPIQDDLRQRCPIAHTGRFGGG